MPKTRMRVVKGRQTYDLSAERLRELVSSSSKVVLDLGCGDGRYVYDLSRASPESYCIGVDLNGDNLREWSRRAPDNALFVVADALSLPSELSNVAEEITINLPWGSLLLGLLDELPGLFEGLQRVSRGNVHLRVLLNAGALQEAGWELEEGCRRVAEMLRQHGYELDEQRLLGPSDLRRGGSRWAKRLAFGRHPRGCEIVASRADPDAAGGGGDG